jgi:hypothetical protein
MGATGKDGDNLAGLETQLRSTSVDKKDGLDDPDGPPVAGGAGSNLAGGAIVMSQGIGDRGLRNAANPVNAQPRFEAGVTGDR